MRDPSAAHSVSETTPVSLDAHRRRRGTSAAARPLPGGCERVLIVDDNRTLAECTRRLLEALGYQALACSDPLQAQTLCSGDSQQDFHLLLTDYAMPQMNGYQLARGLQQSHPRLRVLLCSAWPEDMIREDHLSEEQLPFMEKPFTLETLATRVRQVLDEQVTSESLAAGA